MTLKDGKQSYKDDPKRAISVLIRVCGKWSEQSMAEEQQTNETETNTEQEETQEESLTLTQEELDKKIESESDRKTASALEKQKKQLRAELEKEVKEREAEAARLAKLSQKEREEAEFKKRQDALDKREQELAQKELKAQAVSELHEKQLPSSFADFLLAEDGEKTFENIGNFKKAFDEAVEGAVTERLKGDAPKTGTTNTGAVTKEQFQKMGYSERVKLHNENPDLYQQLNS